MDAAGDLLVPCSLNNACSAVGVGGGKAVHADESGGCPQRFGLLLDQVLIPHEQHVRPLLLADSHQGVGGQLQQPDRFGAACDQNDL